MSKPPAKPAAGRKLTPKTAVGSKLDPAKKGAAQSGVANAVGSVAPKTAPPPASSATTNKSDPDPYSKGHQQERPLSHVRLPVILTTTAWYRQGKYIALWVNPLNASWSLPRRETTTKTAAGVVRNAWRNRYRNSYYDEYTVALTFQTGSVMPSAGVPDRVLTNPLSKSTTAQSPAVPPGLVDFYRFLEMVDQPMLLGRSENRHHIYYRSRVFPSMHLEGYFVGETPIAFTENAEGNANMLQWTATFQVYSSNPPINNSKQLIASWIAAAKKEMLLEIFSLNDAMDILAADSDNNALKAKPQPTALSAKKQRELTSATKAGGRKIGVVAGDTNRKPSGSSSVQQTRNPEILTNNNQGRLIPGKPVPM